MQTKMTKLLNIQYPIMQGGMQWLGVPKLAAAVSEAGGLGTINASCYIDEDEFRTALEETKRLTNKPFAVNISLTPDAEVKEITLRNIQAAAEARVPVIETAGGPITALVPCIKAAKMIHIHKCTCLRHAKRAEKDGADLVTVVGYEAAGHPGPAETGSMVLWNYVARSLSIPVLGGGGIADGAGLAAALTLGCEGVVMGTRFVSSEECLIHPNFKEVIANANEKSTLTCQRNINNMCRYYKNKQSYKALEAEKNGLGLAETLAIVSGRLGRECYQSGDTEGSCFSIGVGAALIQEVKPAAAIIEEMVAEAKSSLKEALAKF